MLPPVAYIQGDSMGAEWIWYSR